MNGAFIYLFILAGFNDVYFSWNFLPNLKPTVHVEVRSILSWDL